MKAEKLYPAMITTAIPKDTKTLHTRFHQYIRQEETASLKVILSSSSKVYLSNHGDAETEEELELNYSSSGSPFLKKRILRGSSSFSTPDYKGNQQSYRGRGKRRGYGFGSFRPTRRVSFSPVKNAADNTGRDLLCSFCNSWFHLVRDYLDRQRSSLHYGDIDEGTTPDATPSLLESVHMYRSID